jgi:dihydrodipicolinate synthase/N-acetylneuraminate lyase
LYYHFPQVTGLAFAPEEMQAVFALPGIVGIKDSALNIPAMRKLVSVVPSGKPFSYFTGIGLLLSDTIGMGGAGVIDPLASIAPELVVACYEALKKGDRAGAEKLQNEINNLLPLMNSFALPVSVQKTGFSILSKLPFAFKSGRNPRHAVTKETLRQLGHPVTAVVKSPLPQITDEEKTAVAKFIRDAGLKKYK